MAVGVTTVETSASSTAPSHLQQQGASSEQSERGSTSSAPVSEGDSGIDPCADGEVNGSGVMQSSNGDTLSNSTAPRDPAGDVKDDWPAAEGSANSSEVSAKVEQEGKKKGCCFFIQETFQDSF